MFQGVKLYPTKFPYQRKHQSRNVNNIEIKTDVPIEIKSQFNRKFKKSNGIQNYVKKVCLLRSILTDDSKHKIVPTVQTICTNLNLQIPTKSKELFPLNSVDFKQNRSKILANKRENLNFSYNKIALNNANYNMRKVYKGLPLKNKFSFSGNSHINVGCAKRQLNTLSSSEPPHNSSELINATSNNIINRTLINEKMYSPPTIKQDSGDVSGSYKYSYESIISLLGDYTTLNLRATKSDETCYSSMRDSDNLSDPNSSLNQDDINTKRELDLNYTKDCLISSITRNTFNFTNSKNRCQNKFTSYLKANPLFKCNFNKNYSTSSHPNNGNIMNSNFKKLNKTTLSNWKCKLKDDNIVNNIHTFKHTDTQDTNYRNELDTLQCEDDTQPRNCSLSVRRSRLKKKYLPRHNQLSVTDTIRDIRTNSKSNKTNLSINYVGETRTDGIKNNITNYSEKMEGDNVIKHVVNNTKDIKKPVGNKVMPKLTLFQSPQIRFFKSTNTYFDLLKDQNTLPNMLNTEIENDSEREIEKLLPVLNNHSENVQKEINDTAESSTKTGQCNVFKKEEETIAKKNANIKDNIDKQKFTMSNDNREFQCGNINNPKNVSVSSKQNTTSNLKIDRVRKIENIWNDSYEDATPKKLLKLLDNGLDNSKETTEITECPVNFYEKLKDNDAINKKTRIPKVPQSCNKETNMEENLEGSNNSLSSMSNMAKLNISNNSKPIFTKKIGVMYNKLRNNITLKSDVLEQDLSNRNYYSTNNVKLHSTSTFDNKYNNTKNVNENKTNSFSNFDLLKILQNSQDIDQQVMDMKNQNKTNTSKQETVQKPIKKERNNYIVHSNTLNFKTEYPYKSNKLHNKVNNLKVQNITNDNEIISYNNSTNNILNQIMIRSGRHLNYPVPNEEEQSSINIIRKKLGFVYSRKKPSFRKYLHKKSESLGKKTTLNKKLKNKSNDVGEKNELNFALYSNINGNNNIRNIKEHTNVLRQRSVNKAFLLDLVKEKTKRKYSRSKPLKRLSLDNYKSYKNETIHFKLKEIQMRKMSNKLLKSNWRNELQAKNLDNSSKMLKKSSISHEGMWKINQPIKSTYNKIFQRRKAFSYNDKPLKGISDKWYSW